MYGIHIDDERERYLFLNDAVKLGGDILQINCDVFVFVKLWAPTELVDK